jgi:competence protein ComEC
MADVGEAVRVADAGARPHRPEPAPAAARPKAPPKTIRTSFATALDERRLFLLLPFALIFGLIASTAARFEPDPVALGAVGACLVAVVVASIRRIGLLQAAVLLAAFWLGFSLLTIHGALFGTTMLTRPAFGTYTVKIDEVLSEGLNGSRFVVSGITPAEDARPLPIRRARLAIDGPAAFASGDTIRGRFRFAPVPGPVLPGGFDAQFHSYFEGIGAYATPIGEVTLAEAGDASLPGRVIDGVRREIGARVDATLTQPTAGIARALITGDQSGVTDEAREVMSTSGLAHVLSVSGLHLTIVAGGVFAALRLLLAFWTGLSRRISTKRLAAGAGIIAALAYFSISGGNVAALRATIMIVLVFGAVIVGRRALTMRNVAIAALRASSSRSRPSSR